MTDTKPSLLELGYWLSSEEHDPKVLVRNAARAEEVGFRLAGISDHFHPWVPEQGQSPFVWSVLGGIAEATDQLRVGTGVTAPLIRMHPAIVAHAAATAAVMLDGRFFLGVGTGERLNEHITGVHWPRPDVRREMLEEAVSIIRRLWEGEPVEHHGAHYTVEQAQLFTRPERPPPIVVAGSSTKSAELAGRIGDGFFGVIPSSLHVDTFEGQAAPASPGSPRSTCAGPPPRTKHARQPPDGGRTPPSRGRPSPSSHIPKTSPRSLPSPAPTTSSRPSLSAPTPSDTSTSSPPTPKLASTRSSSTRSAPTRKASYSSTRTR